jgi:hypothetical protein
MKKYLAKQYTTEHNFPPSTLKYVPNIIHFIYGFLQQETEFEYYKYIAISSAYIINRPDKIYFYYKFEPYGFYWDKIKHLLTLKKVDPPEMFLGHQIKHYAHQSDILRLQILYNYGGIYLDIDTICLKPFDEFLKHDFTIAYQGDHGLCNAVLIAKPQNPFIKLWLQSYKSFRSTGKDQFYDEHSVILPMQLAMQRNDINVLDHTRFFYPLAENINNIMFIDAYNHNDKKFIDEHCYCIHLWESITYDEIKNIEKKKKSLYYTYSQKFHI